MMLDGRVTVNGAVVTELGFKVDPEKDAVKVDGKRVLGERHVYVLIHKPKATLCTLDDPDGRPLVTDLVRGVGARLYPVGRLDYDTTGALLLTNDGELANMLMHPRHRFTKTYLAKVKGVPSEDRLEKLRRGVNIEGVRTAPAEARLVALKEKNSMVELVLREGRNRQVKRMFLEIGHPVLRLSRTAYAFLDLQGLEPGSWRHLMAEEVKRLQAAAARAGATPDEGFKARIERPLRKPRPSTGGAGRSRSGSAASAKSGGGQGSKPGAKPASKSGARGARPSAGPVRRKKV
jgi:23S rRNA pseudouridine2605 synthase